jgi:hypothetical protein
MYVRKHVPEIMGIKPYLESFASRVVANNAACIAGDAPPSGPARFLPEEG